MNGNTKTPSDKENIVRYCLMYFLMGLLNFCYQKFEDPEPVRQPKPQFLGENLRKYKRLKL